MFKVIRGSEKSIAKELNELEQSHDIFFAEFSVTSDQYSGVVMAVLVRYFERPNVQDTQP